MVLPSFTKFSLIFMNMQINNALKSLKRFILRDTKSVMRQYAICNEFLCSVLYHLKLKFTFAQRNNFAIFEIRINDLYAICWFGP